MLTTKEIREVTFSKQVNGYRREEVDVFLDKVESDYEAYERLVRELNLKVNELEEQLSESKTSEGTIQSVLLKAQNLADKIIAEAKEKSTSIIEDAKTNLESFKDREKELSGAFDKKAEERKKTAREALDKIIDEAKVNRDKISEATKKTVEKQAELYNRLKLETAAFKAEIMDSYKKHLELISKIPDSIPADPEDIAKAVDLNVDDLSDREGFIKGLDVIPAEEETQSNATDIIEEIVSSQNEDSDEEIEGFVINTFSDEE